MFRAKGAAGAAEAFGELAGQYSIEAGSRSLGGKVEPIKKNGGQPLLEHEAFSLKPGELSGVIQAGDKYIILLCEKYIAPVPVEFAKVRAILAQNIREKKVRMAMATYFETLQDGASIDNFVAHTSKSPKGVVPASATGTALRPALPLEQLNRR